MTTQNTKTESSVDFSALAKVGIFRYKIDAGSHEPSIDKGRLASIHRPTSVITSRVACGYSVLSLEGDRADESIARILSGRLNDRTKLAEFGVMMKSGRAVSDIVKILYPRSDAAIDPRKTKVSEDMISKAIARCLPSEDAEIRAAYSYVFVRVLETKDLVTRTTVKSSVSLSTSIVASYAEIRSASFLEKMRGIFDSAAIKRWASRIEDGLTPNLLAERITELMQSLADVLPQVARDLQYLDIAMSVLRMHILTPSSVPTALIGNTDLTTLSNYANLLIHCVNTRSPSPEALSSEVYLQERSLSEAVKLIASAEYLEVVSLEKFCAGFMKVPAMASRGDPRGMIIGRRRAQVSRNIVVEATREAMGWRVSEQDPQDNRGSMVAPMVHGSLTSQISFTGSMNILADALANSLAGAPNVSPEMWTFQMEAEELAILAMSASRSLMVLRGNAPSAGGKTAAVPHRIVYTVPVRSEWRMAVMASNGMEATFSDPASAVIYSYDMQPIEGVPMTLRDQTLKTRMFSAQWFVTDLSKHLSGKVAQDFTLDVTVAKKNEPLRLSFSALSDYLREAAEVSKEANPYFYVREPGVDDEVRNLFGIASYFMGGSDATLADSAASWLLEHMAPILAAPVTVGVGAIALTRGLIENKWDLRRFPNQQREVFARTLLTVGLGLLERFEKVRADDINTLVTKMPVNTLSAGASKALSDMQALMGR